MDIVQTAKDIVDLCKKGATIELQERLLTLREEAMQLQEENLSLRREIAQLKENLSLKHDLVFRDGVYYRTKENGPEEGPFCQRCYDGTSKLCRLHPCSDTAFGKWWCRVCNYYY